MTNPTPPVAGPVPAAPAPGAAPVPGAPAPAPAVPGAEVPVPVDGAAPAVDDGASDQALLAQQMSARFSIVKRTDAETGGTQAAPVPGQSGEAPPAAASPAPAPAAAPTQRTLPSTSG